MYKQHQRQIPVSRKNEHDNEGAMWKNQERSTTLDAPKQGRDLPSGDSSPQVVAQRQQLHSMLGGIIQSKSKPPANNTGLPDDLKSGVESLSGFSMDKVKVHYNSSRPAQLNALAYTQGADIHVAPGQEKHLAHEAWHVVQQAQGRVQPTVQRKDGVAVNDDKGLEREADVMGEQALQRKEGMQGSNLRRGHLLRPVQISQGPLVVSRKPIPEGYKAFTGLDPLDKHQNSHIQEKIKSLENRDDLLLLLNLKEWLRSQKEGPNDQNWQVHKFLLDEVDKIESYLRRKHNAEPPMESKSGKEVELADELIEAFLERLEIDPEVKVKYRSAIHRLYLLAIGNSNELGRILDISEFFIKKHGISIIVMRSNDFKASSSDEYASGEFVKGSDERKGRIRLAAGEKIEGSGLAQTLIHELMHLTLTYGLGNDSRPYRENDGANRELLDKAFAEWKERTLNFACPTIWKYISKSKTAQAKIEKVLKHLLTYNDALGGQERMGKELLSHFIEIYFIMREAGVKSLDINFALREDFPYLWQYYVTVTRLNEVQITETAE